MSPAGSALLLGVDGGGATTQALLATAEGQILGRGIGPPSNPHRVGFDEACRAIKTAIEGAFFQVTDPHLALEKSHWVLADIGAACFGLAGVDSAKDEALFSSWLRTEGVKFQFSVFNDSELILNGGTPDGWGVALISGAGSVCLGRHADGATVRAGGWGHVLGDEGSGYAIAVSALRLATQAADGRGGSRPLLDAALAHWKLKDAKDLIAFAYKPETTPDDIASLGARVLELAARRDATAQAIVDDAGAALALHVDTVVRELGLVEPPLALGGSMARAALKKSILAKVGSPLGPVSLVADPVQGAIAAARRMLGRRNAA
jgi:N-acetylglucosamine kinase-like BadF-type ATPase